MKLSGRGHSQGRVDILCEGTHVAVHGTRSLTEQPIAIMRSRFDAKRDDAGRIRRLHIVRRVADERTLRRREAQLTGGGEQPVGVRLPDLYVVIRNDYIRKLEVKVRDLGDLFDAIHRRSRCDGGPQPFFSGRRECLAHSRQTACTLLVDQLLINLVVGVVHLVTVSRLGLLSEEGRNDDRSAYPDSLKDALFAESVSEPLPRKAPCPRV